MLIQIGAKQSAATTVDREKTALAVGSGLLEVFSTPMMIALMEEAASQCLGAFLEPGQSSVGTRLQIEHTAATPLGMHVRATAEITAAQGRRVEFAVVAEDDAGEIGRGTHSRVIIDAEAFMKKAGERR